MGFISLSKKIYVLSLLFVFLAFSQEINLTGKVINEYGVNLAGVKVSIPKFGLNTLTNASGEFQLVGDAMASIHRLNSNQYIPILANDELILPVLRNPSIEVETFDLNGDRIFHWKNKQLAGIRSRIPLSQLSQNKIGVFFVTVRLLDASHTFRLVHFQNTKFILPISQSPGASPELLKSSNSSALEAIVFELANYATHSQNLLTKQGSLGEIILKKDGTGSTLSIVIDSSSSTQIFGVNQLAEALRTLNFKQQIVDLKNATASADITVKTILPNNSEGVKKEGYYIRNTSGKITVSALDGVGAMYGLMEVGDQIIMLGTLDKIASKLYNPRFPFRAIKFNLPWSSYRKHAALQENIQVCKDLKFWESYLNMMAENRFNVLTLWNLHPWSYMITATNFPKAAQGGAAEMQELKKFWTARFAMAKSRGIETYLLNWNIFVSDGFIKNYGGVGRSDGGLTGGDKYYGKALVNETVERYNRESITQVINEYPDLTGLGITHGEGMDEYNEIQQTDWAKNIFFKGIKDANRKIKFIYRAALKGDHTPHRQTIDQSGLDTPEAPIWVELKFNWSHAFSTPTLIKAHGGGTGNQYWTNPAPTHHKMVWMMRNEDFFRLRWAEPDFIREHIKANGQDFVGGYFVGSETYIPAKDLFHNFITHPVGWKYAYERQWLFYKQWGRLLYDPTVSDMVFANAFKAKYNTQEGVKLVEAFKLSSRYILEVGAYFNQTWDFTLYSEGFLFGNGNTPKENFISLENVISSNPMEPTYLGVGEFVNKIQAGGNVGANEVSPLALASRLISDANRATSLVGSISTLDKTLLDEIQDIKALAFLSHYFAHKLKAAERLATYRKTKTAAHKAEAIAFIEQAKIDWQNLILATPQIVEGPLPHTHDLPFSWAKYQSVVNDEVTWVKAQ